MTTQRTFEPHVFEAYAEAGNICRHCDRGKYALHHQQTEFDKVFDQMEAPEYPVTCDNCGEVGTNASMEQHICTNEHHDAPAAPERGDRERWTHIVDEHGNHDVYGYGVRRICRATSMELAEQIAIEHNQHSTLIAQRERLLRLLRPVTSPTACYCAVMGSEKCWHCEARELITAIEQDQIATRTTTRREG